jgi:hypothetical protein
MKVKIVCHESNPCVQPAPLRLYVKKYARKGAKEQFEAISFVLKINWLQNNRLFCNHFFMAEFPLYI